MEAAIHPIHIFASKGLKDVRRGCSVCLILTLRWGKVMKELIGIDGVINLCIQGGIFEFEQDEVQERFGCWRKLLII